MKIFIALFASWLILSPLALASSDELYLKLEDCQGSKEAGQKVTHRPLLRVDFNEVWNGDLVALSQTDIRRDATDNEVRLVERLCIAICDDDIGDDCQPDKLVAEGIVVANPTGRFPHVKWWCRISPPGIQHESDLKKKPASKG